MEYAGYLWLAAILIAVVGLPVIGGPLLIHARQKVPVQPEVRVLDPSGQEVPPPVQRYFTKVARELAPEGFEVLGYFYLGAVLPVVRTVVAYLEKPSTGEQAMASAIYVQMGAEPYRLRLA